MLNIENIIMPHDNSIEISLGIPFDNCQQYNEIKNNIYKLSSAMGSHLLKAGHELEKRDLSGIKGICFNYSMICSTDFSEECYRYFSDNTDPHVSNFLALENSNMFMPKSKKQINNIINVSVRSKKFYVNGFVLNQSAMNIFILDIKLLGQLLLNKAFVDSCSYNIADNYVEIELDSNISFGNYFLGDKKLLGGEQWI